jgi:hypothetical protein
VKIEPVHHTCVIHPHCYVYWWPDPDRNRLRGRSIHIRSSTLYNGTTDDLLLEPFRVRWEEEPERSGPIFWDKEELRRARGY